MRVCHVYLVGGGGKGALLCILSGPKDQRSACLDHGNSLAKLTLLRSRTLNSREKLSFSGIMIYRRRAWLKIDCD